jgi:aldose 1-epimerase
MTVQVIRLENEHWQAGILPGTGGSVAYGRVWNGTAWVDALRSTAESDYTNPSKCASFIMLPWCNRIGGGVLTFAGKTYQLAKTADDGTAHHGDVRRRAFTVAEVTPTSVRLTLDSRTQTAVNWPWAFQADATYRLDSASFVWELALTNLDTKPYPAGFGHHPYFVRPETQPVLQVPCAGEFNLVNNLAVRPPMPVTPRLDFRAARTLPDDTLDDVLTNCDSGQPVRIAFPDRGVTLDFRADPIFKHWIVYAPSGWPSFAVEPMTNVNDGFALYDQGINGTGVFVVQPGQTVTGTVRLSMRSS